MPKFYKNKTYQECCKEYANHKGDLCNKSSLTKQDVNKHIKNVYQEAIKLRGIDRNHIHEWCVLWFG
jgi:hypothetical protein